MLQNQKFPYQVQLHIFQGVTLGYVGVIFTPENAILVAMDDCFLTSVVDIECEEGA